MNFFFNITCSRFVLLCRTRREAQHATRNPHRNKCVFSIFLSTCKYGWSIFGAVTCLAPTTQVDFFNSKLICSCIGTGLHPWWWFCCPSCRHEDAQNARSLTCRVFVATQRDANNYEKCEEIGRRYEKWEHMLKKDHDVKLRACFVSLSKGVALDAEFKYACVCLCWNPHDLLTYIAFFWVDKNGHWSGDDAKSSFRKLRAVSWYFREDLHFTAARLNVCHALYMYTYMHYVHLPTYPNNAPLTIFPYHPLCAFPSSKQFVLCHRGSRKLTILAALAPLQCKKWHPEHMFESIQHLALYLLTTQTLKTKVYLKKHSSFRWRIKALLLTVAIICACFVPYVISSSGPPRILCGASRGVECFVRGVSVLFLYYALEWHRIKAYSAASARVARRMS